MKPNNPGLPLSYWLNNPKVDGVDLFCGACGGVERVSVEKMIAGLKARRLGDETTPIDAIGLMMKSPCQCGRVAWESRPGWKPMRSSHHPG